MALGLAPAKNRQAHARFEELDILHLFQVWHDQVCDLEPNHPRGVNAKFPHIGSHYVGFQLEFLLVLNSDQDFGNLRRIVRSQPSFDRMPLVCVDMEEHCASFIRICQRVGAASRPSTFNILTWMLLNAWMIWSCGRPGKMIEVCDSRCSGAAAGGGLLAPLAPLAVRDR